MYSIKYDFLMKRLKNIAIINFFLVHIGGISYIFLL